MSSRAGPEFEGNGRRAMRCGGMALVEVIVFIVVITTAVGATLSLFMEANRGSVELLLQRQAMAIGEAMLNEVLAAPFSYCDPSPLPANFGTAASPAFCASPEVLPGGPEAGETRLSFDNINDYNGFTLGPGFMPREGVSTGLDSYSISVIVQPVAATATWNGIATTEVALVTVTVTSSLPSAVPVVVQGVRTRYAPNAAPPS